MFVKAQCHVGDFKDTSHLNEFVLNGIVEYSYYENFSFIVLIFTVKSFKVLLDELKKQKKLPLFWCDFIHEQGKIYKHL